MDDKDRDLINALTDYEILALTLAGEAEGEPIEGQVGVGSVIRNRMHLWKQSYKEICLAPKQFSCWLSISSAKDYQRLIKYANFIVSNNRMPPQLMQIYWVANGIINEQIFDNTNGALYYIEKALFLTRQEEYMKHSPFISLGHQLFYKG